MTKENPVHGTPHLMDLLRHNSLYFPHKVALRLDAREVTNLQLLGHVNSIQKQLASFIHPGQRVALWFQNSVNWLASFIAINALGAVSVPINTRLTSSELEIILKDVQP
ncbi:MAG: AMP-binding protein, partial [Betaproteobacteria bacterium]